MITDHTPIIANMCDECAHITKFMEYKICKLHKHPFKLPCVKNNKPCPDHHEKSVSEFSY